MGLDFLLLLFFSMFIVRAPIALVEKPHPCAVASTSES